LAWYQVGEIFFFFKPGLIWQEAKC
jgi:hypothetical protein